MSTCANCQTANPEGYRFCGRCGSALGGQACASCGTPNPAGQPFCGQCGARLETIAVAVESSPVEERKLATVLFADVVGFTSLAERTDPELVARMVDAAFQDLAKVVSEHGGTIDKYMGDSLMAVFGVPASHDDDAERAVAAGLAMRRLGGDLVFSIGINSGEVMATSVGNGDLTVIGDTVNVAARLEKAAAPGEVLCGRLTAELAGGRIQFEERQPVLLKGKSEPVAVWEALRLRRSADGDGAATVPLVGRDDELAFLEMQWRRVRDDREAKLVVLCGDAGSGKSRLLDELAVVVGDEARLIRAAYPAYGEMGGVRVAAELIEQLGPSGDEEVDARVRSVMGEVDPTLKDMDAATVRSEQLWGLGRLLRDKAKKPLVVIIDDLHWGDERTLGLLADVATRMRDVPILTVVAGRTDPGAWLRRFTAATTVRLPPLGRAHAAALATSYMGAKELTDEAREFLVDVTNGNPLYMRELVSVALSRDLLVDDGGRYRLTANAGVPATLQALLAARLDALERSHKSVVQHVALLGEATDAELTGLAGRPVADDLAVLVDAGLVRRVASGTYLVSDPLLGEVAYDMLPRNVRGDLHRRAAELVGAPQDRLRHLERSTDYLPDDVELARQAAEALVAEGTALAEGARHLDAERMLAKAVALGLHTPEVLLELGRIQALCSHEDQAVATLQQIPDDPADPTVAVERDHRIASTKIFTDPAWSTPQLVTVAERWHELGNVSKEAWAYGNLGVSHFYLSEMEAAARYLERGLELFESIGDRAGAVACSSFICLARPADPRVDEWLAMALEYADDAGDRGRQTATLSVLTWKHFFASFTGNPDDMAVMEGFGSRLAAIAVELGATEMAMHGLSLMALGARFTGRFEEAAAHIATLQRELARNPLHDPWLAWAASYSVAVATGASNAAPPFPPSDSVDPVVSMAALVVKMELLLAGRVDEALAHLEAAGPPPLQGPMADVGGMVYAVALILADRSAEASPWVERAAEAAQLLHGGPAALATAALAAIIAGVSDGLPAALSPARGLAEALVLRAWAQAGDEKAGPLLSVAAAELGAPGFLRGL